MKLKKIKHIKEVLTEKDIEAFDKFKEKIRKKKEKANKVYPIKK
jgi:hypothetical protein